jgi:hypothetical protein
MTLNGFNYFLNVKFSSLEISQINYMRILLAIIFVLISQSSLLNESVIILPVTEFIYNQS